MVVQCGTYDRVAFGVDWGGDWYGDFTRIVDSSCRARYVEVPWHDGLGCKGDCSGGGTCQYRSIYVIDPHYSGPIPTRSIHH
ncbi:hypothetical protein D3C80_1729920 [compost metagenome]